MAQDRNMPVRSRREERLALGIAFGAIGSAALASLFVALSPTVTPKGIAPTRRVVPASQRADLSIDVRAAVASAATAAAGADTTAAEAQALAVSARAGRGRTGTRFAHLSLPGARTYDGEANDSSPEGIGIMRGGPVAFAAGFFVDGVRSGPGVDCANPDCTGASYAGDFRANAPTGSARVVFPDGAVYRGEVRDGAPDGFGELVRADGSKYVGGFTAGRRDGHGVETSSAGKAQSGFWTADQLSEGSPS